MPQNKIVGYKNMFGFVLPDWVDESLIRTIVTFMLSVVVMMSVLIFVTWPKFDDITVLKSTLKNDTTSLASLQSSQVGLNTLSEQISTTTQDVVLAAIPQTYSPENAIFLLRKIGDSTGVSIVSYKLPSGAVYTTTNGAKSAVTGDSPADFTSYPINITVSAPVSSLLSFIDKVETSIPFGVVSDVGMQEVTKLANANSSSVQMDLEITYYQAVLNKVDISKIDKITSVDLDLVKTLSGYNSYSSTTVSGLAVTTATASSGLFGF